MSDPKGFMKHARADAPKRPARERATDWAEIVAAPEPALLREQATRCMDCGVPFCQSDYGCPLHNRIPEWNDSTATGNWERSLDLLHATNNFPEFTGRLCPAPCESACVLALHSDAVTIRGIENTIIEEGFARGFVRPKPASTSSGRSVAVVGSGPAGLAAAQQLARAGHAVTVYEREPRAGGLLRYGIPSFKMSKQLVDRRLEQMVAEGVRFVTGAELGKTITLEKLRREHDAVALCLGAEKARELTVPGRDLRGVHLAMEFLTQQNRRENGDPSPSAEPEILAHGKRVIVIGGGDTGSDCVGTAIRQGAASVQQIEILSRPPESAETIGAWPLAPLKLRSSHAHEEGCERAWGVSTVAFEGTTGGDVRGLRIERGKLVDGAFKATPGSGELIEADLVILALGFTGVHTEGWSGDGSPVLSTRQALSTNTEYETSLPGVYAAGDARRGASLIVWAIAEGRAMAASIDRALALKT